MGTSTVRVLLVDDYEPWRRFIISSFQKWPELQVVGEAADGREAVRKSEELRPDLILLDIGLPTMNGIEAAREIRQQSPRPRVLCCSENPSADIAEAALRAGAGGYLVKSDAEIDLLSAVTAVIQGKRFVSRRLTNQAFAKTSDSGLVHGQGHVVQFYKDSAVLLDELALLFRDFLGEGQSVAVVMTSGHRSGLERRLLAHGVDVSEAAQNGRLCILDAEDALNEFMDSDGPNRERFLSYFRDVIRRAQAAALMKNKPVVAFGEMVAVLWAQSKYAAAIRLEELWNELARTCSFYLHCAYPASAFSETFDSVSYTKICALHSDVVSAFEPFEYHA